MTVLSVIGTRPEAIKMAPVIRALKQRREHVRSLVCVTGQHRQMLTPALRLFDICPDCDLELMKPDQQLYRLTGDMLAALGRYVEHVRPDWILAQGDTTTVLVAALVAFYQSVRFGHVEAGLRTGDRRQPFPEEMNRRLADMVADAYFAPTVRAREALLKEGVPAEAIHVTGNTVVDALLDVAGRGYDWSSGPLAGLRGCGWIVLVTAHRRESFGAPLRRAFLAVRDLAKAFERDGGHFVYPVHLNPNVRRPAMKILSGLKNVHLLEPLDYLSFVHLMKRSRLILTDSGGIQEEAPSLGVPVLVMRDRTERAEGVEAGAVRLVGTQREGIRAAAERLLRDPATRAEMAATANPYGDGRAAERIVAALLGQAGVMELAA